MGEPLWVVTGVNFLLLGVGILLLVSVVVDLLWTTLWSDGGAGPLSSRLMAWTWKGLRTAADRDSRLLSLTGPLVLTLTLVMWIGLLWAGWTFVFAGGDRVLIDTREIGPISWTERAYFVAYTMFTMGNGDFTPVDGAWQIATSLMAASGMTLVTLGASYILSVLDGVVNKRAFASTVTGIAEQSETLVLDGWDGDDLHELDLPLDTLSSQLSRLAKQHQAYPVLHYYHTEDRKDSSPIAVAVLDEALTLLRFGVPEKAQPNRPLVDAARSSTQDYLGTLHSGSVSPADEIPPSPALDRLREAGVPTVSDEAFAESLDDFRSERRRKLLGAVRADAGEWPSTND